MGNALGFEWYMDQTVIKHATAPYTATPAPNGVATVAGAGQTGLLLTTSAITGGLNQGDIIQIAGVSGVNHITKVSYGQLKQFVVTSAVATGGTQINIYPAIIPGAGTAPTVQVQYQTVDVSPANGARVTCVTNPSASATSLTYYRKNFVFAPEAVTLAMADLELPRGVHEADRQAFDGVSMRMVSAYNVQTDQFITRLDVLYGYLWVRPEWACIVGDQI
jgi:hypothetical protein